MFSVTLPAAEKLKEIASKQGFDEPRLRVRVVSGGCAGMQYQMDFSRSPPAKDDIVWESNGIKILIDPKSALYVFDSELDYTEGLMGSGFKINNPNVRAKCSCGESFTV